MTVAIAALHLVYDAPSGALAAALDSAKKLLGLGACPLCDVTHGLVTERSAWRACKRDIGVPIRAWHRDDMPPDVRGAVGGALPAVAVEAGGAIASLLGPAAIRSCAGDPERLATLVREALAARGLGLPAGQGG